ncbi:SRPBCC family protein [Streptomyces ipomoeae]|uniref:Carbon monoxide dehydrogenase subunit G n=1 Tax=Streptomyces ipomoeae 91-03 TaxID=698759 RepID=L1L209_9ACTN|nr:SRPBCC family protein [Streptomyces ipomoeae]EKX66814.1 carbon monoxide dehydrogenase subunit G [Streptomyces ipomoeae 91-03]MDX2700362.1 SRPBCC family protein [Streptomyces ipomoeae]MDX2845403.1 SRPBCC family protein [Streptomyces ipomoeae]
MEHEVFVPVPVDRLREALSDPERVARAVPGLQQDAGTPPVAGRLKVRVAGHTITYRGTLRVTPQADGTYAVEGDATEARGTGSVKLALTVRLIPATEGTTVNVTGTATADGRVTELPGDAVTSAMERLLGRFAGNLGDAAAAEEEEREAEADGEPGTAGETDEGPDAGGGEPAGGADAGGGEPVAGGADTGGGEPAAGGADAGGGEPVAGGADTGDDDRVAGGADVGGDKSAAGGTDAGGDKSAAGSAGAGGGESEDSVFEAEIPPSSLDPFAEDDFAAGGEPPAEAAHARRTMIGRSAEEVDHAPPRGRYAPVPAPETVSAGTALRWAAPAAALVLASAIIVGRALRKRR